MTVSIANAPTINEGGNLVYTVTLSGTSTSAITVPVTYTGTAADGSDYTSVAFVTIPAGSTSATLTVATNTDSVVEGPETVVAALGTPTGAPTGAPAVTVASGAATASGSITDTTNHPPVANSGEATGKGGTTTPLSLSGTDIDGTIASFVITVLPTPAQGVITLADGTPIGAGQLLTPAQAAGLLFKANPSFSGDFNLSYKAIDNEGASSLAAAINLSIKQGDSPINPTTQFASNPLGGTGIRTDFSGITFQLPSIPLQTQDAIFVVQAVRESQVEGSQSGGFNTSVMDSASNQELNNISLYLQGTKIGAENTVFVQNAVHGQIVGQELNLFVHNSVLQSQFLAMARHRAITAELNQHNPFGNLTSVFNQNPFAIDVADALVTLPATAAVLTNSDVEGLAQQHDSGRMELMVKLHESLEPGHLDIPKFAKSPIRPNVDISTKPQAAIGFSRQVQAASQKLTARSPFV